MKLRAKISMEFDVADFATAAAYEAIIRHAAADLKSYFPSITVEIKEARTTLKKIPLPGKTKKLRRYTGNLHTYID